jgi:hypothetical protein
MDHDMSDLKPQFNAQRRLLQAISEAQSDHTTRILGLETSVGELKTSVGQLQVGQATVLAGVQVIIGLLGGDADGAIGPDGNPGTPE